MFFSVILFLQLKYLNELTPITLIKRSSLNLDSPRTDMILQTQLVSVDVSFESFPTYFRWLKYFETCAKVAIIDVKSRGPK